ncbi:MAG: translation initiation factor IF-2 N-terminal domain-containing protein [Actinobacteria bacterium]|nr:translation initiation factor IF-2 N-terminal domain-containing protein [Actinomycetota bacterium]
MRVYELAKQMGISSIELMDRLQELGVEVKNHFATVDPALVKQLKDAQIASSSPRAEVKKEEQNEPQEEQKQELPEAQLSPVARPWLKKIKPPVARLSSAARLWFEKIKQRDRKFILISSLASVVVVLLVTLVLLRIAAPEQGKPGEDRSKVTVKTEQRDTKDKKEPFVIKPLINVLVVGAEGVDGREKARGLLLAKLNFQNRTIQAVSIPERTYLSTPDLGLDQIGDSLTMGIKSTKRAVEGLLKVPIENYIIMHHSDFEYLVNERRFEIAFNKAVETGFLAAEKEAYRKKITRISAAEVNIISLPVKLISINGEPYCQPDNEEVNRLLEALWGIKREANAEVVRVIILNGSGQPGIGRDVSNKLYAKGFMVSDIRNADNFDYKNTRIIVYNEEFKEKAKAVKQILGVGDILIQATAPDLAEIAIIIGKDYKF